MKKKRTKKKSTRIARAYRRRVNRRVYLAQDRCDIGFAIQELARGMAKLTVKALQRFGRHRIEKS